MKSTYLGVHDTEGAELAVSKHNEVLALQGVEEFLPGLSNEFREICKTARHLFVAESRASIKEARTSISKIVAKTVSLNADLNQLDAMTMALVGGNAFDLVEDLLRVLENAYRGLDNQQTGARQKFHRDWLAMEIVELMLKSGKQPSLVRDTTSEDQWTGDTTYAELLRFGIGLVEGKSPTKLRAHMKRGLELFKASKYQLEKTG